MSHRAEPVPPPVLQVDSDEIVAAARKNGAPVEWIVFRTKGMIS
jgi:hypothetical protein